MLEALAWADLNQPGLHWQTLAQPADFAASLQLPGAVRVSDGVLVAGVGELGWIPAGQNRLRTLYTGTELQRAGQSIGFDPRNDGEAVPAFGSWQGLGLVALFQPGDKGSQTLILAVQRGTVIGSQEWDTPTGRLVATSGRRQQTAAFPELGREDLVPRAG